jgi:uncharacterized protein (DUF983 family)
MVSNSVLQYDGSRMNQDADENLLKSTAPTAARRSQPIDVLWWRAMRLRCPACGRGPIFKGWFAMHEACPACGRRFNRGAGYLLGSIYFNYGVTAMIVVVMYFAMFFGDVLTDPQRLLVLSAFGILFPAWFFRYARAYWIAFDERWDPWPNEEEVRHMQNEG